MADYILDVVNQTSKLDWAFPFQRTGAFPLDRSSLFSSYDDAVLYASGAGDERDLGGSSYVGQTLSVYDADTASVTLYIIEADRSLKAVGSAPLGDDLSIEIVDGVIQLKNFGKSYYAYVPAVKDEAGNITEASKYVLTEGFKAGLEPRVVADGDSLIIAWYEPGSETVEDIAANVESVSKTVDELDETLNAEGGLVDQVDDLKTQVGTAADETGNAATGLYAEIERIDGELDKKANADEVKQAIAEAVAGSEHLKREVVDALPAIEDADVHTIYMVPSGLTDDDNKYYEWMVINGVFEQVGSWEVDLSEYAKTSDLTNLNTTVTELSKTVSDNKTETDKAIEDLNSAVADLEADVAEKVDKVYYTVPVVDENGDPVLDESGNPVTEQVEGTLLTPEDKEKLAALVIDEDGSVGISGTVNAENVEGLGSWITNEGNKYITNLTEDNLSSDLVDKINFITAVDDANFTVTDGLLELKAIAPTQVTGLQDVLDSGVRLITQDEIDLLQAVSNGDFNNYITGVDTTVFAVNNGVLELTAVPVSALGSLGDFTSLPNTANNYTLIDEINNLYKYLTWTDMA